jgi:hypothetical protein
MPRTKCEVPPVTMLSARTSRRADSSDEILPVLSRLPLGTRFAIIVLGWGTSVATSAMLDVGRGVHDVAVTVHVLSLVTAFGAVLMVDWHGALWMLGHRALHETTRIAAAASPLIWLGIGGLLASGALLHPDLGQPLTVVKIGLVLVVALNGAVLSATRRALAARPPLESLASLPRQLRRSVLLSGVVSQLAWCGAMAIGFLTATQHI